MNKTTKSNWPMGPLTNSARIFLAIQAIILATLAVASMHTAGSVNERKLSPMLKDQPWQVRPLYDHPFVIADEQLELVLQKLHPAFSQNPTKINFVDHAIRMWGEDATFDDEAFSGKRMLNLLLNNEAFSTVWGSSTPLIQKSAHGIRVNTQQGRPSVSHVDHLMGTLAEIGVPLSHPVRTPQGSDQVGSILRHALATLRVNQREYEWTTLAAAFYAQNGKPWYSADGQLIDFNVLARRIMRQQQPQGVCYGQHRLYTLTMLLRIDDLMAAKESDRLLSSKIRKEVMTYLLSMTQRLFHSQSPDGYWDGNWPSADEPIPDPTTDPLSRRILATGHVLEWWAMAPKELHPPRHTIVNAAQWLAREIEAMDQDKIEKNYTFLTHAGRALALWRCCLPAEFERQNRKTSELASSLNQCKPRKTQ